MQHLQQTKIYLCKSTELKHCSVLVECLNYRKQVREIEVGYVL